MVLVFLATFIRRLGLHGVTCIPSKNILGLTRVSTTPSEVAFMSDLMLDAVGGLASFTVSNASGVVVYGK